jgi:hypothetical protein
MVVRRDIDEGGALHLVRMVEAHPVRGARAPVMAGNVERVIPQRRHDLDLVLRHRPKRVVDMIFARFRRRTIAVPAQVGRHHVIARGQPVRDLVPGHMRQRIAVQQQQGRSIAAMDEPYPRAARVQITGFESLEHSFLP